jgi:hypothetical protein
MVSLGLAVWLAVAVGLAEPVCVGLVVWLSVDDCVGVGEQSAFTAVRRVAPNLAVPTGGLSSLDQVALPVKEVATASAVPVPSRGTRGAFAAFPSSTANQATSQSARTVMVKFAPTVASRANAGGSDATMYPGTSPLAPRVMGNEVDMRGEAESTGAVLPSPVCEEGRAGEGRKEV